MKVFFKSWGASFTDIRSLLTMYKKECLVVALLKTPKITKLRTID